MIGIVCITILMSGNFVSCNDDYDDSILTGRVDNLENRVKQLEELCKQMNTNISSLQTIVTALENNDYITDVTPVMIDGENIGYTIKFLKSNAITIYHGNNGVDGADGEDGKDGSNGKDGSDGVAGVTPIIGVKQDVGNIYYWTVNNEWLLDEAGNKIKAQGTDGTDGSNGSNGINGSNGKDGITPKLKIGNGYWYVSYDNGSTWTELGKATGEDGKDGEDGTNGTNGTNGDSFFQSVDANQTDYVVFKLSNGTEIKLPTWTAFENLQTLCNKMNTNIIALQTIVAALQSNDYIKSVTPVMENGIEIGYTITFTKSNPITIYHGKDGEDGENGANGSDGTNGSNGLDGKTPVIGVKKYTDGIYYWTVNNEWLLDEVGNKVKAQGLDGKNGTDGVDGSNGTNGSNGINGTDGKDGITPKFKIEDGYWYVSYDNESTWTELGKAQGEDGKDGENGENIFSSVTQDENNVYFNLVDGTIITISKNDSSTPKPTDFIQFDDVNVKSVCIANWDRNNDMQLSYEEAASVTSLGTVFKNNTAIIMFEELQYFTGLTTIENDAFSGCINLTHIIVPVNVKKIASKAFYECKGLINIILGNNVEEIGNYAFYFTFCKTESSIIIPNSVKIIGNGAFQNANDLISITLGDGIESIGENSFYGAGLKSVTIGDNVGTIGDNAFGNCTFLKKVILGSKVSSIGKNAFYGSYVTELYSKIEIPFTIATNTFNNNGKDCTIYVPKGRIETYKATSGWGNFSTYKELE